MRSFLSLHYRRCNTSSDGRSRKLHRFGISSQIGSLCMTSNIKTNSSSSKNSISVERANLLELFGLSALPEPRGPGAIVDEAGRLHITCEYDSRQKHETALVFTGALQSANHRDFLRILSPGKHMKGWRGYGGLEQSNSLPLQTFCG